MVSDHSKDTSLDPLLPFLGLETRRAALTSCKTPVFSASDKPNISDFLNDVSLDSTFLISLSQQGVYICCDRKAMFMKGRLKL